MVTEVIRPDKPSSADPLVLILQGAHYQPVVFLDVVVTGYDSGPQSDSDLPEEKVTETKRKRHKRTYTQEENILLTTLQSTPGMITQISMLHTSVHCS